MAKPAHQTTPPSTLRRIAGALLLAALIVPLAGCPPGTPGTPGPPPTSAGANHLCFVNGYVIAPTIDGMLRSGDAGWLESFRYIFENGTEIPDAIVQGLKTGSAIYLSFEVNTDNTLDVQDAVLIGFSPTGTASNDRRIIIYPLFAGAVGSDGKPQDVVYSTNSQSWNTASTIPSWLKDNDADANNDGVRVSASGTSWTVEVKIPITSANAAANPNSDTGINLPASGSFGMYFNVVKALKVGNTVTGKERRWPESAALTGSSPGNALNLEATTPAPTAWGKGSLSGTVCNGVNVGAEDLYVEHPTLPNQSADTVVRNHPNIYAVRPTNSMIDPVGGQFIEAKKIGATFFFNDWGIAGPGSATLVPQDATNPGGTNPTLASTPIPAATTTQMGSAIIRAGRWTPTQSQGVCSSVELRSDDPGTTFVNHKGYNNFAFVSVTSPFDRPATIGSHGYKLPDGATAHDFTLRTYTYNTPDNLQWTTELLPGAERGELPRLVDGAYTLRLAADSKTTFTTRITPPDVRLPSLDVKLPPGANGRDRQSITAAVVPGGLVTVLAQGAVQLRKNREGAFALPATPNGLSDPKAQANDKFLLPAQHAPHTRLGALIGSWDGFQKTSFPIDAARTLRVPADVKQLHLAINDTAAGYAEHSGQGFEVQVIATPLQEYLSRTDAATFLEAGRTKKAPPLGANLPTWLMCGERSTGKFVVIKGVTVELVEPTLCFSYIVRRIGVR